MSDAYIDPQSGILRNKIGLTDQESLDREEANAVSVRSILLQLNPLKGNFDSEHLKEIHSYLFRDVYTWAGQYRTVSLAKADFAEGGRVTKFTPPELIETELSRYLASWRTTIFSKGCRVSNSPAKSPLYSPISITSIRLEKEMGEHNDSLCANWRRVWATNFISR